MRQLRIAVIPGDGIGVDVTAEAVKVLEAVAGASGSAIRMTSYDWGADHYLKTGVSLPADALEELQDNYDAILLGAIGDPRVPDKRHAADILLGVRFRLDLYVNFRPVRFFNEQLCPLKGRRREDVDFVVFRENTEGLYVMMGGNFKKGTADEVATEEDVNTRKGVERIMRAAFEFAQATGRKRVIMADKSNALIHAHDLWQRVFRRWPRSIPGSRPTTSTSTPCAADGQGPRAVPGHRDQQHVRRHRDRPRRGAAGRARHGGLGQHPPRPGLDVRARPRLGAEVTPGRTTPTRWARS